MKIDRKMDSEDATLQFTFNGSLVNKHFEKILDILGETLKSEKQVRKNKEKIVSLLSETFSGVTNEKLANSFNLFLAEVLDNPLKRDTLEDINFSMNRFSKFILSINDEFKDRGYSILVTCYFWLTEDY